MAEHVGLAVRDLGQSVDFYRDVLGMELIAEGTFERNEQWDAILEFHDAAGKSALLKTGNLKIELVEFVHPRTRARGQDQDPPMWRQGITHFCIGVADIEQEYNRLERAGVRFHCPPLTFRTCKATYGRDPEGNVFELREALDVTR